MSKSLFIFRPTSVVVAFALALMAIASPARANDAADRFAKSLFDRGLAILRENNEAGRDTELHQLVLQNIDARKMALFALGSYQRGLDQGARETYISAFTDFITTVYEARLKKWRDFDIKVLKSRDESTGEITVLTQGKPVNDRSLKEPIIIGLRLAGGGGNFKIVDVQVAGIWISVDQRERFAEMLGKNNADVRALTSYLNDTTAQIKSGTKRV